MARIMGVCVFRNEGDGCLTSKYVNEMSDPFTESCKLIARENDDQFSGRYQTTWLERMDNGDIRTRSGELLISQNPEFSSLSLRWVPQRGGEEYEGVGMLFGDLLVASYWSLPR